MDAPHRLPEGEAGAGGSPRDGSGTSCGDGKRQKASHSGGVLGSGPAKNAAEISDVRDNWHNEREARLQQRIAELREITARPEFKEAMKPTSPSEPLYDSDDVDDEEWYWEEVGYDLDVRGAEIPRTTDESLCSNENYYQAMKYAVDNSGTSRGLYTTEERASEYRDAVRVVIKSNHPNRSKIVDLLLLANIGFHKSHQDEEPLALTTAKLWCTDTPEDCHDLLCALKRNNVSFDEKNAEGVCANDMLPRWVRAII